jgi:hypothetical protein
MFLLNLGADRPLPHLASPLPPPALILLLLSDFEQAWIPRARPFILRPFGTPLVNHSCPLAPFTAKLPAGPFLQDDEWASLPNPARIGRLPSL